MKRSSDEANKLVQELTQKVRELVQKDLDRAIKVIDHWVDYSEKKTAAPQKTKPSKNYPIRKKAA